MSFSSSVSPFLVRDRGLPSKCVFGLRVTIFTSQTPENPNRPFCCCISKRDVNSWTSKRDVTLSSNFLLFTLSFKLKRCKSTLGIGVYYGHLFKWEEDAVFEDLEDALPRVSIIKTEINKGKSEANELTAMIEELKEEAMVSQKEIWKLKVCFKVCVVWLCFITIVLVTFCLVKQRKINLWLAIRKL